MVICSVFSGPLAHWFSFVLFLKNPDEQEVVVEVPRVPNPPKPVMTTRPTAVKATGTIFFFFHVFYKVFLSLRSNWVCIYFVECFSVANLLFSHKWKFKIFENESKIFLRACWYIHINQSKICCCFFSVPKIFCTAFLLMLFCSFLAPLLAWCSSEISGMSFIRCISFPAQCFEGT